MATHHANHLRHEGWRTRQKFAGFISDTIELLACVIVSVGFGWFVGLSQWSVVLVDHLVYQPLCYNVMNPQLGCSDFIR